MVRFCGNRCEAVKCEYMNADRFDSHHLHQQKKPPCNAFCGVLRGGFSLCDSLVYLLESVVFQRILQVCSTFKEYLYQAARWLICRNNMESDTFLDIDNCYNHLEDGQSFLFAVFKN